MPRTASPLAGRGCYAHAAGTRLAYADGMWGFWRNATGASARNQGAPRRRAARRNAPWSLVRDTRGASLGEYVVLLGLIGIVGLMAWPKLGTASNHKVEYTANCGLLNADCAQGNNSGPSAQMQAAQAAQADLARAARLDSAVAGATPDGSSANPGNPGSGGFWNNLGNGLNTAWNGYLSYTKGFFVDGLWGTVTGLYTAVTSPVQTAKGIWNAVTNPVASGKAIWGGLVNAWNEDPARLLGAGVFEVITLPIAAIKAGKATKVTRIAEELENIADAGRVADRIDEFANAPGVSGLPRTGSALKGDPHHAFPNLVDNFARDAQRFEIPTKGPGGVVVRTSELFQVEGSLNGKAGVFEWIVDQGSVTHRRFIPGGTVTGFPNQIPGK